MKSDRARASVLWSSTLLMAVHTLTVEGDTLSCRERDGSLVELSRPTAILAYTKYMGGVDLGDQLRKYYSVRFKCRKIYKLLYIIIIGSFFMFV